MEFKPSREFALECDAKDQLAAYRRKFFIPKAKNGSESVYLCGNSLGLEPRTVPQYVNAELDSWAERAVEGHFAGSYPWLPYHEFLTPALSKIVGGKAHEVVAMNTLTVNLHLMMVSFYRPSKDRYKILHALPAFPSDRYAIASQARFHGYEEENALISVSAEHGDAVLSEETIEDVLRQEGKSIALVMMDGVNYYSGQALDIERITKAAHDHGCTVGFDLAHAAGNIELKLHDWNVDFAIWCSYKYLNGGPGCVAGCFVHERHGLASRSLPRFAGWWGHNKDTRFKMGPEFAPIPGVEGWQLSNPPILPLAALRASLELFDLAGMPALREKSKKMTGLLEFLIGHFCGAEVRIITPRESERRGCQLSLELPRHAKEVFERLQRAGVVCDWREPNVIRVAPVPLYNSFLDVFLFAEILRGAIKES